MFGASGLNGGKGGLNQVGLQLAWRSRRSKSGRILVKVKEDWIRCAVGEGQDQYRWFESGGL